MGKVKDVFVFTNGNTMVFDESGEQIPEYQGFILDIAGKLMDVCDEETNFECKEYCTGHGVRLDVSWWFEQYRSSDIHEGNIDAVLEVQQRDKMMMQLRAIKKVVGDLTDVVDKKFVPLEESAFEHGVCSMLNTAKLCIDAAAREFDKWLEAEEGNVPVIPEYQP